MKTNLRIARLSAGMTQEELSRRSGVARSVISALENGRANDLNTKTVKALAKALGTAVGEIFMFDVSDISDESGESND